MILMMDQYKDFRSLTQNSWIVVLVNFRENLLLKKEVLEVLRCPNMFLLQIVINVGCQLVYNVEDNLFPFD